jgi:hypothetical protein
VTDGRTTAVESGDRRGPIDGRAAGRSESADWPARPMIGRRGTRRAITEDTHHLATYVVRVSRDASSRIRGVVVHVATGERFAFDSVDGMALLIRERVELDAAGHT